MNQWTTTIRMMGDISRVILPVLEAHKRADPSAGICWAVALGYHYISMIDPTFTADKAVLLRAADALIDSWIEIRGTLAAQQGGKT